MATDGATILAAIRTLGDKARALAAAAEDTVGSEAGWWVLGVGGPFGEGDLAARDRRREELRRRAAALGFAVLACEWVFDETNRAQIVLGRFRRRSQARAFALSVSVRGLSARVAPAFEDAAG